MNNCLQTVQDAFFHQDRENGSYGGKQCTMPIGQDLKKWLGSIRIYRAFMLFLPQQFKMQGQATLCSLTVKTTAVTTASNVLVLWVKGRNEGFTRMLYQIDTCR